MLPTLLSASPRRFHTSRTLANVSHPSQLRRYTRRRLTTSQPPERPPTTDSTASARGPPNRQLSFNASGSSDQHLARHVLDRITDLDRRLNYQGWHTLRWTSLLFIVAGSGFWLFRENVSSGVGEAASEVTRRTLESEEVQHQASELARGVVYELLNDKRALELSAQFLNEVIQLETTKKAVLAVVQDILGRPETEIALRGLVSNVLTHQESAEKAVLFLQHVVAIPESRDALVTVLKAVFAQPTTQAITSDFFKSVMQTENFVNATNKLGADTVQFLLANEDLRITAVQWSNAVLNDPALQSTAGDAVWAAVKGAFVPWGKPKPLSPTAPVASSPTPTTSVTSPAAAASSPAPVPVPGAQGASVSPARATIIVTEEPVDASELLGSTPSADEVSAPTVAIPGVPGLVIDPSLLETPLPEKIDQMANQLTPSTSSG